MSVLSDKIKNDLPLIDVIRYYLGEPKRKKWSCPFHTGDKTPSLSIKDNRFTCFGCAANGDIFDFVGLLYGVDFKKAVPIAMRDFGYSDKELSVEEKRAYAKKEQARKRDAERIEALKQIERELIQECCDKRRVLYCLKKIKWCKWSEIEVIVNLQNQVKILEAVLDREE